MKLLLCQWLNKPDSKTRFLIIKTIEGKHISLHTGNDVGFLMQELKILKEIGERKIHEAFEN